MLKKLGKFRWSVCYNYHITIVTFVLGTHFRASVCLSLSLSVSVFNKHVLSLSSVDAEIYEVLCQSRQWNNLTIGSYLRQLNWQMKMDVMSMSWLYFSQCFCCLNHSATVALASCIRCVFFLLPKMWLILDVCLYSHIRLSVNKINNTAIPLPTRQHRYKEMLLRSVVLLYYVLTNVLLLLYWSVPVFFFAEGLLLSYKAAINCRVIWALNIGNCWLSLSM